MKKSKYLILFLIAIGVGFVIFHAQAASILNPGLISEASCPKGGTCSLNTFLKLGISVATYILGIVGALTLLMFVYGGVTMIISGGSADKVKKGKDIIIGSVVGLMIVFGSYLIISFVSTTVLNVKFDGKLPEEQKTVQEAGGLCKSLPGGYCAKNTGSCAAGETSAQSDCAKDEKCCYVEKKGTCADTYGGQCVHDSRCQAGGILGGGLGGCTVPTVCCDPSKIIAQEEQICGQPTGICKPRNDCINDGGIDLTGYTGCPNTWWCCDK